MVKVLLLVHVFRANTFKTGLKVEAQGKAHFLDAFAEITFYLNS